MFLGLSRRMTGCPIPEFLDTAAANIGSVTSPLSMMVIGTLLVGVPWKKLLEPSIFYLAFVRLIALPLVALMILRILNIDPVLAGVSLILTGMPAAAPALSWLQNMERMRIMRHGVS